MAKIDGNKSNNEEDFVMVERPSSSSKLQERNATTSTTANTIINDYEKVSASGSVASGIKTSSVVPLRSSPINISTDIIIRFLSLLVAALTVVFGCYFFLCFVSVKDNANSASDSALAGGGRGCRKVFCFHSVTFEPPKFSENLLLPGEEYKLRLCVNFNKMKKHRKENTCVDIQMDSDWNSNDFFQVNDVKKKHIRLPKKESYEGATKISMKIIHENKYHGTSEILLQLTKPANFDCHRPNGESCDPLCCSQEITFDGGNLIIMGENYAEQSIV